MIPLLVLPPPPLARQQESLFSLSPSLSMSRGKTSILIHTATNLRNTQRFGTQDPYIKVTAVRTSRQTRVDNDGGKSGSWNQKLDFIGNVTSFTVQAWNENSLSDSLIGQCEVPRCNKGMRTQLQLKHKGKPAGDLIVTFDWEEAGPRSTQQKKTTGMAALQATRAFGSGGMGSFGSVGRTSSSAAAHTTVGMLGGNILRQTLAGNEVSVTLTPAETHATRRISYNSNNKDDLMPSPNLPATSVHDTKCSALGFDAVETGDVTCGPGSYYFSDKTITETHENITTLNEALQFIEADDQTGGSNPIVMWQLTNPCDDGAMDYLVFHRQKFLSQNLDASTGKTIAEYAAAIADYQKEITRGTPMYVRRTNWAGSKATAPASVAGTTRVCC